MAGENLLVSMDEKTFVAGSLPSNFDGELVEARACIWNYDNGAGPKIDANGNVVYTLALRTKILSQERDEAGQQKVIWNWWSAGDPTAFVPTLDGSTPAPLDEAGCSVGIGFMPVGTKKAMNASTNLSQALSALSDAELLDPHLKRARSGDVRWMEGLYGHWERIALKKKDNNFTPAERQDGKRFPPEILVITKLKVKGASVAPAASGPPTSARPGVPPVSAPAPVAAAPGIPAVSAAAGPLDEILKAVVLAALATAPAEGLLKGKLAGAVLASPLVDAPNKAKSIPRIGNNDFLKAGMEEGLWAFDDTTGLLFRIG